MARVRPFEEDFWRCFIELSQSRRSGFAGAERISYESVSDWLDRNRIGPEEEPVFRYVVSKLDSLWMEEAPKAAKRSGKKKPKDT